MSFGMVAASYLAVIDDEIPTPVLAVAFDEGSGDTFSPTIGPGTGTITPGYGQWTPGPNGGTALGRFSIGPNESDPDVCAILSGVSSLNTASWTGMTVMAWVNAHEMTTAERWPLMLLDGTTPNDAWMGWRIAYNSRYLTSWFNGVPAYSADEVIPDDPGGWAHLCITWDGATQHIYADGVLTGSVAVTGPLYATSNIAIGSAYWSYGARGVDDLRIYNTALTQAQITALMGIAV